jgi:hypothetical protein
MKGFDRFQIALEGSKPDRAPMILGNYQTFLTHFYGASVNHLLEDAGFFAELSVQFIREFGFDLIRPNVGYIFYGCGPELGVKWEFVENNFPGSIGGCIINEEDLNQFKIPKKPSGYFEKFLDIHRILVKEIGREIYVRGVALGPFSAGCFLRGLENFLLDSAINIDFFRSVLKKCVDLSNYFVRQILLTGAHDLVLNEVFLTPGILSHSFFQEVVYPCIQAVLTNHSSEKFYFYQQDFLADGNLPDGTPKKGLASAVNYGTKQSLKVIRQGLKLPIPGHPPLVTVSGRSLVQLPVIDILDFIRKGIEVILEEGMLNPCIHLVSVQAASKKESLEIAEKINQIRELREGLSI